jgi:hypothetical protein
MLTPFTPLGATVNIAANTSTGNVALTTMNDLGGKDVRVYNAGAATVFVNFGISTVTAATTDMPVPAGAIEVITVGPAVTHAAAITSAGTATVYFTSGRGC